MERFANCTALETIKLPNNLKNIEEVAFVNTSLKSVIIPDSVVKIGASAFDKDVKLKTIIFKKIKNRWCCLLQKREQHFKNIKKKTSYKAAEDYKDSCKYQESNTEKRRESKDSNKEIFYAKRLKRDILIHLFLKFTTSNKK